MIAKWLLALVGLNVPVMRDDPEAAIARRRVEAALFQHGRILTKTNAAALDIYQHNESDQRPAQMIRDVDQTRETIAALLGKMR